MRLGKRWSGRSFVDHYTILIAVLQSPPTPTPQPDFPPPCTPRVPCPPTESGYILLAVPRFPGTVFAAVALIFRDPRSAYMRDVCARLLAKGNARAKCVSTRCDHRQQTTIPPPPTTTHTHALR